MLLEVDGVHQQGPLFDKGKQQLWVDWIKVEEKKKKRKNYISRKQ